MTAGGIACSLTQRRQDHDARAPPRAALPLQPSDAARTGLQAPCQRGPGRWQYTSRPLRTRSSLAGRDGHVAGKLPLERNASRLACARVPARRMLLSTHGSGTVVQLGARIP
eukprot:189446-Prymnesium_polylepis.1